jgi:hypothetical protein
MLRGMNESIARLGGCITKPTIWRLYETISDVYKFHAPSMRFRSSLDSMMYTEYLYAIFSHSAYRYLSETPIRRINEFTLHRGLSDPHSVVFTNEEKLGVVTRIVVAFRGTDPSNVQDLMTDVMILFGKETTAERFRYASAKIERIQELYPEVPIVVCGHSLGGSLAIHVARRYNLSAYTYNPAQGLCHGYLQRLNRYPKIRVYRINTDMVSSLAGLENVSGLVLFPPREKTKSHSIVNFLPAIEITEEFDL